MGIFNKWSILVELGLFIGWLVEQEKEEYRVYIPPFLQEEEEIRQADLMNTTCMACFSSENKRPVFVAEIFDDISISQIEERLKFHSQYGLLECWIINVAEREVHVYSHMETQSFKRYSFLEQIPLTILQGSKVVNFNEIMRNCLQLIEKDKEVPLNPENGRRGE